MATPIAAKGTLIKKGAVAIVDVANFELSGFERILAETSNLDDAWATYISSGLVDGGEVSFDILYDPADTSHKAFITDMTDGSADTYTITFADTGASVWSFSAIAKSFGVTGSTKDKVIGRCVLKITGAITPPA